MIHSSTQTSRPSLDWLPVHFAKLTWLVCSIIGGACCLDCCHSHMARRCMRRTPIETGRNINRVARERFVGMQMISKSVSLE
mmetsp:Transcript_61554/g.200873  ORF Transcript_61554/g.200873 Transcript_61554/m.200873 type:complete len:82 (-) Transcript_61554:103-348(-)